MEFSLLPLWLLDPTYNTLYYIIFLFSSTISFFLFSYYFLTTKFIRLLYPCCCCEICQSFINSSWREKFTNLPDWYTHLLKNSPTKTINIHILNNTIIAHPKNVEYILKTNFQNYPKGKPMSTILGDLLGQGIFVVDGDHWRFQRKLASFELGSVSVRAYAHNVLGDVVLDRLVPALLESEGQVIDLQDVLKKFSFVNICKFSFGTDPTGLDGLDEAFDVASRLSAERALSPSSLAWRAKRALNVGSEKRLKDAVSKVKLLAEKIIVERRKSFTNKNDLLSRFMGSVTDDKYLRDIVVSFLLAGRDTVASGLTVFFYLMARNSGPLARILEESNRALAHRAEDSGPGIVIPTLEELREMHYLHAAIYESLRLFPPVQMDSKFAKNDDVLPDGTHIKAGTRVSFHPYAMGRMESIWGPDCLEFEPERWLNKDGVFVPENPYKYTVFQAGFRICLGKDMALLSMKMVALILIRRFDIRLDPNWAPHFIPGLTATLKGGMPVIVTQRDCASQH